MKLLIELPDGYVGTVMRNQKIDGSAMDKLLRQAVIDGTPLDKIKAEIESKCDRINSLASALPYTAHREIQELLCDILDLCKAESEDKKWSNQD